MSLALIQESAQETRRLAIAGSPLAVGDFRLKKLIAPLEQAGAKAPVFAQVAKAIGELVNGTEAESAGRLLTLSTLLNAILYTQGESGSTAGFGELEIYATKCSSTRTTARVLKPLVNALTSAGAGRFEIIKDACARNAFNDLRLIDPAIYALGDSYSELGDLVAEKILPGYGPGIVPRLKIGFDLKGKKHDARKLTVMHRLDPDGTLELCKTALDDGSPEVKAAAIACLGKHEECLPLVLEQANSKNKTLRAAALEALAEHDRPEVVKLFGDFIKGDALELLARPFRAIQSRLVLNSLLEEGKRVFELLLKGESEQIPRFGGILDCVEQRKDAEVEEFLLDCFERSFKLANLKAAKTSPFNGLDVTVRLASLLSRIGSQKSLEALLGKRNELPTAAFTLVFDSALRAWPADKVYQEFQPLLGQTAGAGKEKSLVIQRYLIRFSGNVVASEYYAVEAGEESRPKGVTLDPRWLDAAIKADLPAVVCHLAQPGNKAAISYLIKLIETKPKTDGAKVTRVLVQSGTVVRALARCQYPTITDVFLKAIAERTKGAQHIDYDLQSLFQSASYLPPADLPKLDAFAASLDEKFVDQYLEALGPLRSMNQTNQS
ncbi:MAG TPA: HEAT repeat domain-containing protein [Verrucomicrobiae bacterium]|nr:HEAT repeat domain-containing protein [Verrucomicrobiae bacterium]